ncbi:MAG: glycoside hydrolase family 2 protein, partial [Chloroflexi bacterium]|nr:glycoside hydrolase family 2 protein [Chloroflexota bacterium]
MTDLLHGWKLQDFAPGHGHAAGAHALAHDDHAWLETPVPGDVHRTLLRAGRIEDPFYDRNESRCAWIEQREWWYRLTFDGDGPPADLNERLLLVFDGLDTFASVFLNGQLLGEHHNMFRPAEFDVTGLLRAGQQNVLAVRFDPPLERIAGQTQSVWGRNPERTPMRKAQFGYGWDWGPRLPTVGIWRPVKLVRQRQASLRGVHFKTLELAPDHTRAAVAVRVEVERFAGERPLRARFRLASVDGTGDPIERELMLDGLLDATAYLSVDRPRLWWTHELGEPARYVLEVALLDGTTLLDQDRRLVGIRTLALDQSPDPVERGTRFFRFTLNGVPIFAKGADWIPCDSFVAEIAPEHYTRLVEAARDANMTMLRVWGGGIYEHDQFYGECDRLGLLVWQDFMFACAMYPEDQPDFVAEVDAEARYQVRRLRSHPSLALWCGNNENQWLHDRQFWDRAELPPYGALYYDRLLPAAVAELDGRTPYWPGSPFGGNDHNDRDQGNVHNWEVWHGNFPRRFGEQPRRDPTPENVSYRRYAEDTGRFI